MSFTYILQKYVVWLQTLSIFARNTLLFSLVCYWVFSPPELIVGDNGSFFDDIIIGVYHMFSSGKTLYQFMYRTQVYRTFGVALIAVFWCTRFNPDLLYVVALITFAFILALFSAFQTYQNSILFTIYNKERVVNEIENEFNSEEAGPIELSSKFRCKIYLSQNWIIKATLIKFDLMSKQEARFIISEDWGTKLKECMFNPFQLLLSHKYVFVKVTSNVADRIYHSFTIRIKLVDCVTLMQDHGICFENVNGDVGMRIMKQYLYYKEETISITMAQKYCLDCRCFQSEVIIQKQCNNEDCGHCTCPERPAFCIECLAQLFADTKEIIAILRGIEQLVANCPICHNKFCALDCGKLNN